MYNIQLTEDEITEMLSLLYQEHKDGGLNDTQTALYNKLAATINDPDWKPLDESDDENDD